MDAAAVEGERIPACAKPFPPGNAGFKDAHGEPHGRFAGEPGSPYRHEPHFAMSIVCAT